MPSDSSYFPHPFLVDEQGVLAFSDTLTPEKVLLAYQFGIFPWYNEDDPVVWWFTYPRLVLFPYKLKIQKSMRSYLNQDKFRCTFDTRFNEVVEACRDNKRDGQEGTWISDDIINVYGQLHQMGYAHSVEVWDKDDLVGGLYGLSLGKVFYGESMFTKVSNASKFGFIKLVQWLESNGIELIDCQQETPHLKSMGAEMIDGVDFFNYLKANVMNASRVGKWDYSDL